MVDAKAVIGAAVVALVAYSNSWAAACLSWVVSAVSWCVRGLPCAYMVGRCLEQDVIGWHYYDSVLIYTLSVLGPTVLACWYVPRCAATCGALALAYDYYVHELVVDGEFVEESFATDLCRWVSLRRKRGLSGMELAVAAVVAAVAAFVQYTFGGPAAYSAAASWAGSAAYWCVIGFLTFYVVFRCLDHIVDIYGVAEHMPFEVFLLSVLGLTVLACRYVPRCAVICGTLGVAYDYYFHGLFVDLSRTGESFAGDLRRWVSLRRERGLSNRELAVAGVALCLAAFAAGYWVVVADAAPRAAWEWLRYGARCFCGLIGAVSCWFLVTGLAGYVQKDKGGLTAGVIFAGGVAVLTALWFHAWHLVVGFGLLLIAYDVCTEDLSVVAGWTSGPTWRVAKLLLVLALVMEPGAVAAAVRAEFLGEGEQFGIIGPAELDWLGFVAGTWRRLFVRAVLVAWGFYGSVARIRRPGDAWFIDVGCALAIYFGGQALGQLGSLLYALGQLEAVYALGRALCEGTVFNASKRFFFGAGPRDVASRASDVNWSSLTTTLSYVCLVLLAAGVTWIERGEIEELDNAGLAVAFATNCFAFYSIVTGYLAIFGRLFTYFNKSLFFMLALIGVVRMDASFTNGYVTDLVQNFGAALLLWRAFGALTPQPIFEAVREVARAVHDGIAAGVNRARDDARGRADDRARRAADEAAAELLRDEERRERRPGPRRRAVAKPEPEPDSDSDSDSDSSAEQESEPEVVEADLDSNDKQEIERLMATNAAGKAKMMLVRQIETYPLGRRAKFADGVDANKFGDYARKLTAMSPEAFVVTYAAAAAAAKQNIAKGVDPDFALVDFFIATLAVTDGKGWSEMDSVVNRALAGGDQELAAAAIRMMPQYLRQHLGETFGFTTDTIDEYADQVDALPSEDFELMHRAAYPMAQRSGASPGGDFTKAYASHLVMMFRRGIRPCDAKAYDENDRLHTEADAAEKAGNHAAAAKLRATARAKNGAILEAQAAAKKAEMRAVAEAKATEEIDRLFSRSAPEERARAVAIAREEPGLNPYVVMDRAIKAERRARELAAAEAKTAAAAARAANEQIRAERQASMAAEAKAKADQAAAELLAAEEEAEASAAAAKKRKKKKKKKRGGAAPMPSVEAPPVEAPLAEAVAAMFEAAAPSPADKPSIDEPQQHDELSDDTSALLRRLGLEERVGPVFAREQIDENALPFLTVEDLVEAGVAAADARKVVSAAAVPEPVEAVAPPEPAPAPAIPDKLCCPISLELMERPVMAADGFTYDRSSIESWLARGNTTSPTTGAPLEHLALVPNHLVRSMVSDYQDSLTSR